MVVVRFSVFEDKVRAGTKKQTIRPWAYYKHLKVGNAIHCYSTKKVPGVRRKMLDELLYTGTVTEIVRALWDELQTHEIAIRDGFDSLGHMCLWFDEHYSLSPQTVFRRIRWD